MKNRENINLLSSNKETIFNYTINHLALVIEEYKREVKALFYEKRED